MDIPIYTLDGGDPEGMLISLFLVQNWKNKIQNNPDRCPQYTYKIKYKGKKDKIQEE